MRLGLMTKWLDIFPLLAPLVGSGIVAENSARENAPVALLANTFSIEAMPVAWLTVFRPISGAHFNPPVPRSVAQRKEISVRDTSLYAAGLTTGFFWQRLADATTAKDMLI